jgi:hypothetical protein
MDENNMAEVVQLLSEFSVEGIHQQMHQRHPCLIANWDYL